ncbi:MAG: magnesium chelatase, partial [Cyclobacteriaceae bacterium]|nr:magnesium chelatase [Cyclobacteriaceae bacterium]
MPLAKSFGGAVQGVDACLITIEVNVGEGTKFYMVGLPDSAVKESEHRVITAIKHLGYTMPRQKVVVNMAPADIRKEGSSYDLPIALSILQASGQLHTSVLSNYLIMGELALDGSVRSIKGVLPIAIEARHKGLKGLIVPLENSKEAAIVNNLDVIPVASIQEAIEFLEGRRDITPLVADT